MKLWVLASAALFAVTGCSLVANYEGLADGGSLVDGASSASSCPKGAFFCDGFESGDDSRWSSKESYGVFPAVARVDVKNVYRGNYALHVAQDLKGMGPAETTSAGALIKDIPLVNTGGTFAARVFVYLPNSLSFNTHILWLSSPKGHLVTLVINDDNSVVARAQSVTSKSSSSPIPIRKYACLEWVVTLGKFGHESIFIDGKSVVEFDGDTVGDSTSLSQFKMGFPHVQGTTGREIFFDDVALASFNDANVAGARLGCD
ncbi:MAG: hypothetical protein NVS3B20_16300 [Polyangiales bacterium]